MLCIIHLGKSVPTNTSRAEAEENLPESPETLRNLSLSSPPDLCILITLFATGQKENDGKNNENNVDDVLCISSFHRDEFMSFIHPSNSPTASQRQKLRLWTC